MDTAKFLEPKTTDPVQYQHTGLKCWQKTAYAMPRPHRHDDIEVNLVSHAPLRYLFGGTSLEILPGQVGLFWAAIPHRLVDSPDNWRSYVSWLHIPLGIVLNWGLPEPALSQVLRGRPLLREATDSHQLSPDSFTQWSADLDSGLAERRQIALLEIQAHVRRLVHADGSNSAGTHDWTDADDAILHAAHMAHFAATQFREPINAAHVASSAHLHPNYAMTLFHQVLGTTIGAYLAQCRVAEAQRLLITTHATTSEIAAAAGFGSQSAFYATFTKVCGQPPGAYRRSYQRRR